MVAHNKITAVFFLFFSFPALADSVVNENEIFSHVNNRVMKTMKHLGDRITYCNMQRSLTSIPVLNKQIVKSNNVTKEQIILAIAFFNFNNYAKCEGDLRINLAYELGTLTVMKKHYNLDVQPIEDTNLGLMYPSFKDIEVSIKYSKLPVKLRSFFEKTFDGKPFDLLKTIEANR